MLHKPKKNLNLGFIMAFCWCWAVACLVFLLGTISQHHHNLQVWSFKLVLYQVCPLLFFFPLLSLDFSCWGLPFLFFGVSMSLPKSPRMVFAVLRLFLLGLPFLFFRVSRSFSKISELVIFCFGSFLVVDGAVFYFLWRLMEHAKVFKYILCCFMLFLVGATLSLLYTPTILSWRCCC